MRRSASEVIRNLERRVARLESETTTNPKIATSINDSKTGFPLFQKGKLYTLRQFIRIAKKSEEGKIAYRNNHNFGKGIKLAEYLIKNIPSIARSMKAEVYRTDWNYGGNLIVKIELGGKSYNQKIFSFNSANATRSPSYSFATMFNGAIKPSTGQQTRDFGFGTIHGTYQFAQFDKFMEDVVGIFNDFERLHGTPFDVKSALAEFKAQDKIRSAWSKLEPKIQKHYLVAKENARMVSRDIVLRMPELNSAERKVYYKTDEPRALRHPDEYGDYAYEMLDSEEYAKYEKSQAKISGLIESFCQKFGLDFVWAGSW